MKAVFASALCFTFFASAAATAESTQIFPGLRKRMQQQKLAAVQKHTEISQKQAPVVAEESDSEEAYATVPAPLDAGADGFPQLPAVSKMLGEASSTVKSVNSQASGLEARVVQAQMQSESKMAKQKAAFEEKLKQQEEGNQAVIKANAGITSEIKGLQQNNAALKKHAKEIEALNKVMRSELHTLEGRLGTAKDFTTKSLSTTDDSKNSLLQVLKGGKKNRRHHALVETSSKTRRGVAADDDDDDSEESDDKDDDEEDDEEGTSFLSMASKVRREDGTSSFEAAMSDLESAVPSGPANSLDNMANVPASDPSDLLAVLVKDVANLAQQEKQSEKSLKTLFIRDFRAGAKRHQALLAQQKGLIANRGSLQNLQDKLKTAVAHLEATKKQLGGRLHGLGQFLQKLAHLSMAPQREVPHLLEVLPKAVAVKA